MRDELAPWRALVAIALLSGFASIAIGSGHLTLPAAFHPDHDPFFTFPNPRGELMFKYPPLWPAVLALAGAITGTSRAAVPVVSAVLVLGAGALAWELTGRRRVTVLTAALVAACPLVQVLAASRLAYAFSAALLVWASYLLIRSGRTGAIAATVGGGLVAGLAFFSRPYDTLLFLVPVVAWVFWEHRVSGRQVVRFAALASLGALPPLAALAWTDWRITGSATRLPYSAVGPKDLPGFGLRIDTHGAKPIDFTLAKGVDTLGHGLVSLLWWMPLSVVGVVALVAGIWFIERRTALLLAAMIATIPLGYVFFWGAWNGYIRFDTTSLMGPMYYLPIAVPLALSTAIVLDRFRARIVSSAIAAGFALAAPAVGPAVHQLVQSRRALDRTAAVVDQMVARAGDRPALVIVDAPDLLYRYPIYNRVDLDGRVVGALDNPGREVPLLERFSRRTAVRDVERYVLAGRPGHATEKDVLGFPRQIVIERLTLVRGPALAARVSLIGALQPAERIVAELGTDVWSWPAIGSHHEVTLESTAVELDGTVGESVRPEGLPLAPSHELCLGRLENGTTGIATTAPFDRVCFDIAQHDGQDELVVPGRQSTRFAVGAPTMLAADVSDRIVVTDVRRHRS